MKLQSGFSIIELTAAMAILTVATGVAVGALMQAQVATNSVAQMANAQQNLRAGMHFVVRDLMQAGEGIPPQGITVPNTAAGTSTINRPGIGGPFNINQISPMSVLPVVIPGWRQGARATTVNPLTGVVSTSPVPTDTITVIYADNTLVSSNPAAPTPLSATPVYEVAPAVPVCAAGAIAASGLTVTLDPACFTMPGKPQPIQPGDLIMFSNANGTALEYVTRVAGTTITFAAGDPAGLNATGLPNGTVTSINAANVPTVISRVWMVTYYIDTATNQQKPQLVRQVNYPGFPAGAPTYPPQQIADCIEDLNFTYDIVNSTAPAGTYGAAGPGDAQTFLAPDNPFQIRAVNAMLAARSEYTLNTGSARNYYRNNLTTQVSIRSLAFVNQYNSSATAPQNPTP